MVADMEEYATLNIDSGWDEDIGHELYREAGVRLNKEDALMVLGLRFFLTNGHDLELLKSKYPDTIEPLSGFITMVRYKRCELPMKDLHKLAITLHRLHLGFERHPDVPYDDATRVRCNVPLGPSMKRYTIPYWTMKQVSSSEEVVARCLIDRIWYDALDMKVLDMYKPETVYRILSDTNVSAWRGPMWKDIRDMVRLVLTFAPEYKEVDREWGIRIDPFDMELCKDCIIDLGYDCSIVYKCVMSTTSQLPKTSCVPSVDDVVNAMEKLTINDEDNT